MLLKDLLTVLRPEDKIAVYDRFHRLLVIDVIEDLPYYMTQAPVDCLYYSTFHMCQAVKLKIGKFE